MRLRLDVAYDGSGFSGFADNAGVRTVGGELRAALERIFGVELRLTCAGRTDAGVHAVGQVVTVDVPDAFCATGDRLRALRDSLVSQLAPEVVVLRVSSVPDSFDARFSARSRTYRYRLLCSEVPDPFAARTSWWVPTPLDRTAMEQAARLLVGEHDFSSFCRRPKTHGEVSLVRRVLDAHWSQPEPKVLEMEITATAFCHQMVRSIVGLMVDVGRGRRRPGEVTDAIEARDRSRVPNLAPPHGLTLWSVDYG